MIIPLMQTTFRTAKASLLLCRAMHRQLDKSLPEVTSLLNDEVVWLCNLFLKKGFEIRVVGGAVRDMLLKRSAKDIDLSTTATPTQMIDVFKENNVRYIETGLQHGTITAHLHNDYEVTTLRIDVETYGRKAKVEFTHDWRLDALRRDLTFNAMSMDVNAVLFDYFNGEKDLQEKKVRFVGNAHERIKEDYLRILRYFRFYGKIASDTLHHDTVTLDIIKDLSSGLKHVAVERIWLEFNRILTGNFAPHLLQIMYDLNVAENFGLPMLSKEKMVEFERVWSRAHDFNPHPVTLLVTLVDDDVGAEEMCLKWKLSTFDRNLACFISSHRYKSEKENPTMPLKFYHDILVRRTNAKNTNIIRTQVQELLKYEGKSSECKDISEWVIPKFPVTGADLKQRGIKQGPDLGKILNRLKDLWIDSYYTLSREYLMDQIQDMAESIRK